jgi:hypothetical protein
MYNMTDVVLPNKVEVSGFCLDQVNKALNTDVQSLIREYCVSANNNAMGCIIISLLAWLFEPLVFKLLSKFEGQLLEYRITVSKLMSLYKWFFLCVGVLGVLAMLFRGVI